MENPNPNLREYLTSLSRKINSLPSPERVASLEKAIREIEKNFSAIQQQINSLTADIPLQIENAIQQQISSRIERKSIDDWQTTSPFQKQPWKCVTTLSAHKGGVNALAVSRDKQILVSVGGDNTLKVWHLSTGELLQTLSGASGLGSLAITPDGQTFVNGSGCHIKIWNPNIGEMPRSFTMEPGTVYAVAISCDAHILAAGNSEGEIIILDLYVGQVLRSIDWPSNASIRCLAISPDNEILAAGSSDYSIKLWDLKLWKSDIDTVRHTLIGHSGFVNSIAFTPDGQILISGSSDKTIRVWNTTTGQLLNTIYGHLEPVRAIAISPDGQFFVSASQDETIRFWNVSTGELHRTLSGHLGQVFSVNFGLDGETIVSGSQDMTIKIWRCN